MYNKTRVCECCGKELQYSCASAWRLAEKNHTLCKSCGIRKRKNKCSDLSVLLDETPEAYYWMGFLLADGHFSGGRLVLGLSNKDRQHLDKFCKFIKYKGKVRENKTLGKSTVSAMDKNIVEKICEKFDIKHDKTVNPPNSLSWIPEELLYCLFAGFIDGDGNISKFSKRNDCFIRIKIHSSWLKILNELAPLFCENKVASLNKDGYAELFLTGFEYVKRLKRIFIEKNLPIMDRKWEKIDLNLKTKYEIKRERDEEIPKLLKQGLKVKEISSFLGVNEIVIYKYKKEHKND